MNLRSVLSSHVMLSRNFMSEFPHHDIEPRLGCVTVLLIQHFNHSISIPVVIFFPSRFDSSCANLMECQTFDALCSLVLSVLFIFSFILSLTEVQCELSLQRVQTEIKHNLIAIETR